MLAVRDIAWIAGLFEGEGWFGHRRNGDLVAQITMTDGDVIDRVHQVLGFGTRKERLLPSGKTAHIWSVTNQRQAAGLMMTLLALMGERRRGKILECLEAWKAKRPWKLGPLCSHGHPLSGDNLRIVVEGKYEKRRCIECAKLRQRKHRSAKEANA
jgi:hypothetical protein